MEMKIKTVLDQQTLDETFGQPKNLHSTRMLNNLSGNEISIENDQA